MNKLSDLYKRCQLNGSSFWIVIIRYLYYKLRGKKIVANNKVMIHGIKNIKVKGTLRIGMSYVSFMHKYDKTYLNINGKFILNGDYSIARGCRIAVKENAIFEIGEGGYVNANTVFKVEHGVKIGDDCAISWNCQFLDEDFHEIEYNGQKKGDKNIEIGNHVWIGCFTYIYKGTIIPDNCVIAANSVVKGVFTEKNTLIAGNPAKVIKTGINWT